MENVVTFFAFEPPYRLEIQISNMNKREIPKSNQKMKNPLSLQIIDTLFQYLKKF